MKSVHRVLPAALAFCPSAFSPVNPAHSAVYYVDKLRPGSDLNSGTSESAPFLTIQRCFDVVAAGDKCQVKNGVYNEAPTMGTKIGTSALPIIIENYPGHKPVIDGSGLKSNGVCLGCNNDAPSERISHVTFQGFELRNVYYAGIKLANADHVVIRRNHIHHIDDSGILGGGFANTADRNVIVHCGWNSHSTVPTGYAMYIRGQSWTITNNLFVDSNGSGIQAKELAYDPAEEPSALYGGFANSLIANNTFAYNLKRGIDLWAGVQAAGETTGPTANVRIRNNIFYENATDGISQNGVRIYGHDTPVLLDHNLFYSTPPRGTKPFEVVKGAGSFDTSGGGNITGINPNMTAAPSTLPASPDFRLTTGSMAAIDKGLNLYSLGVTLDFDGKARPASEPFDLGAYEYGVPPASTGGLPLDLQGPAPQEGTVTLSANKPGGAATATLVLTVFDADFANEGELSVNSNAPIALFPVPLGLDQRIATVTLTMPASYWVNGDNSLRFTHLNSGGYRVEAANVSFSGPPFTPILLQAESMILTAPMTVGSDPLALGGRFISASSGAVSASPVREASAPIDIPFGGAYFLWARLMGPSSASDALYVGIDGSFDRVFTSTAEAYQWLRVETSNGSGVHGFELPAGSHILQIGHGELDARLDALYLTADAAETPTFRPDTAGSACDVNKSGASVDIVDVQLAVNQALLQTQPCTSDVDGDGFCDASDIQRVVNAALGGACITN